MVSLMRATIKMLPSTPPFLRSGLEVVSIRVSGYHSHAGVLPPLAVFRSALVSPCRPLCRASTAHHETGRATERIRAVVKIRSAKSENMDKVTKRPCLKDGLMCGERSRGPMYLSQSSTALEVFGILSRYLYGARLWPLFA